MRYDDGLAGRAQRARRPARYGFRRDGAAAARRGYDRAFGRRYGHDYWWLGEHELRRDPGFDRYDAGYRRFDSRNHPRFTPVGGMYPAMGGRFARGEAPRPLREPMWMSEWTRWF